MSDPAPDLAGLRERFGYPADKLLAMAVDMPTLRWLLAQAERVPELERQVMNLTDGFRIIEEAKLRADDRLAAVQRERDEALVRLRGYRETLVMRGTVLRAIQGADEAIPLPRPESLAAILDEVTAAKIRADRLAEEASAARAEAKDARRKWVMTHKQGLRWLVDLDAMELRLRRATRALKRLASSEAFGRPGVLEGWPGEELAARIQYADRAVLGLRGGEDDEDEAAVLPRALWLGRFTRPDGEGPN